MGLFGISIPFLVFQLLILGIGETEGCKKNDPSFFRLFSWPYAFRPHFRDKYSWGIFFFRTPILASCSSFSRYKCKHNKLLLLSPLIFGIDEQEEENRKQNGNILLYSDFFQNHR